MTFHMHAVVLLRGQPQQIGTSMSIHDTQLKLQSSAALQQHNWTTALRLQLLASKACMCTEPLLLRECVPAASHSSWLMRLWFLCIRLLVIYQGVVPWELQATAATEVSELPAQGCTNLPALQSRPSLSGTGHLSRLLDVSPTCMHSRCSQRSHTRHACCCNPQCLGCIRHRSVGVFFGQTLHSEPELAHNPSIRCRSGHFDT